TRGAPNILGKRSRPQRDRRAARRAVERPWLRYRSRRDLAEIPEPKLAEVFVFADEQQRRRFTLVNRGERISGTLQVYEVNFALVPVLERELTFDPRIRRACDGDDAEPLVRDHHVVADADPWIDRLAALKRDRVFGLRIAQPAARVIDEADMPLV